MDNRVIFALAESNPMSNVDRLVNLYWALSSTLVAGVEGDVVELGCNAGKTSVLLRMVMDHFDPGHGRQLHVYDSFQALPPPGEHDDTLGEGDCKASTEHFERTFERWHQRLPVIHVGWFHDTLPHQLLERIAFAYLDSDFYEPIKLSLQAVYPRMTPGAIAVIDDYGDLEQNPNAWNGLPGVRKAADEFFATSPGPSRSWSVTTRRSPISAGDGLPYLITRRRSPGLEHDHATVPERQQLRDQLRRQICLR